MKTRFLLRYSLILSVLSLFSCSDKQENDPTPKTVSHEVAVHILGENLLAELRPVVSISTSQRRAGTLTSTVVAVRERMVGSIDTTYTIGTMTGLDSTSTDAVMVSTYLLGCGGQGGSLPPVGSTLTATILVDGKKATTVTLDRSMKGPNVYNDYVLSGSLFQEISKL